MIVSAIPPGAWCGFEVRVYHLGPRKTRNRRLALEAKGLAEDRCGDEAEVLINGKTYCRRHAGEVVLQSFIGERKPRKAGPARGATYGCRRSGRG